VREFSPRQGLAGPSDVAALLLGDGEYDVIVIVLDVDNGPWPLSAAGNEFLYGAGGLRAFRSKPCGGRNPAGLVRL
jgi:hypothetical protein